MRHFLPQGHLVLTRITRVLSDRPIKQMTTNLNLSSAVFYKNYRRTLLALCLLSLINSELVFAQIAAPLDTTKNIKIKLSDEIHQAINSGVGLSFTCQVAMRESFWLFAISRKQKDHHFSLTRHALSNRYLVKQDKLDTPHIFRTISEATNYITFQSETLLEFYSDEQNPFSIRVFLNKFNLPGPMRLNAFISESWNLDTGWILWTSAS